jgi:2-dehydro-3-deoxy-D-arabinonate dehydratase
MKLCRFQTSDSTPRIGLVVDDQHLLDLTGAGVSSLTALLDAADPAAECAALAKRSLPRLPLSDVKLLAPVERQEVWAAGVTYLRSKKARMEESDFSATAYDRVYDAPRPEIFFKSTAEKVVGPGDDVGIRADATWNVPEPELALVLNSRGGIVGYTIGNDMSSRDIEGENLLYLPQAKVYSRACALGPWIVLGATEAGAREWSIGVRIGRGGREVFAGETKVSQIKRGFAELAGWLCRSQEFPHGAVLLTGTGVVPDDGFTLQAGDEVKIVVTGIGQITNPVRVV